MQMILRDGQHAKKLCLVPDRDNSAVMHLRSSIFYAANIYVKGFKYFKCTICLLYITVIKLASLLFFPIIVYLVLICRHVKPFYERPHCRFNNNLNKAIYDPLSL